MNVRKITTTLKLFSFKFSFLPLVLNEKVKMKTRYTLVTSYSQKNTSTQEKESYFSLVWFLGLSIISSCLSKVNIFPIALQEILVDV